MSQTPLADFLYRTRAADRTPVTVFDVGCSHDGVGPEWNVFGPALRGIGFDPLVAEIERLRAVERRPDIAYEAAFVGLTANEAGGKGYDAWLPARLRFQSHWLERSSATRALTLTGTNYIQQYFNAGDVLRYSDRHLAIDDYARETRRAPDVLKIDTDGFEMDVLRGAERTIAESAQAVHVECMFQGPLDKYGNNLATIDTFLRERGLQLFTMEPFRYSRAALPAAFHYDIFAQTESGPLAWADALYLRDLASPGYEDVFGFAITAERVFAMAAIMEAFGLQDCAAEMLLARADRLPYPIDPLLDLLVPRHLGTGLSYRDYIARFEADPGALMPSRLAAPPPRPIVCPVLPLDLRKTWSPAHWGADLQYSDAGVTVTTAPRHWGYAAFILVPDDPRRRSVEVDIGSVSGRVGLTLAADLGARVSEHAWLDGRDSGALVVLHVPVDMAVTGVLIRNGTDDGSPSTISIRSGRVLLDPSAPGQPIPS